MSNIIRHPRFVVAQGDGIFAQLEAVIEDLHSALNDVKNAARLFSPAENMELRAACEHAIAEVEEMKRGRCFTQDRLNELALRLDRSRGLLRRKQSALGIPTSS